MAKTFTSRLLAVLMAACLAASCFALAACGGSGELKDGTYTGKSTEYEGEAADGAGYGVVTITIEDGTITDCQFQTYELDGTLKDENYGVSLAGNENKYYKAQTAVEACDKYAAALVDAGTLDGVDMLSGATVNYSQFQEAVDDALAQARA